MIVHPRSNQQSSASFIPPNRRHPYKPLARARSQTSGFMCACYRTNTLHKHTHAQCAKSPAHIVHTHTHTHVFTRTAAYGTQTLMPRTQKRPCYASKNQPRCARVNQSTEPPRKSQSDRERGRDNTHTHTRAHAINKRCQSAPLFNLRCAPTSNTSLCVCRINYRLNTPAVHTNTG